MSWQAVKRGYQIARVWRQYRLLALFPPGKQPKALHALDVLFFWVGRRHQHEPLPQRLSLALQALGPVFIKFGQMLSTRKDLLSGPFAEALAQLQDQALPFDSQLARERIEAAIGGRIEEHFSDFQETALASGSVAQVHSARLRSSGDDVVLKVTRPGIDVVINSDLALMEWLARRVAATALGPRLQPQAIVADYRRTILAELDLTYEAANTARIGASFMDSPVLYVPRVFEQFSHPDLLVTERIYGVVVTDIAELTRHGTNMKRLAERGVEVFFTQVFRDNFFHADMHPGNIFIDVSDPQNPSYIGIDYGIVGQLSEQDNQDIAAIFLAFFRHDYARLAQVFLRTGWVDSDTNISDFEFALRQVFLPLQRQPLGKISFGHVLVSLFRTAQEFGMVVKPQFVLLEKTLLYVEGLGRQLYPELDLWSTAKPYLEQWQAQRLGPKRQWQRLCDATPELLESLPEIPMLIHDNLQQTRHLLRQSTGLINGYVAQRERQHKSNLLFQFGGILVICSTILLGKTVTILPSLGLAGAGLLAWFWSWQVRKP